MERAVEKCLVCGARIPVHTRRCPHCGRELLDRNVWYNKYASNIVGAFLGAVSGPVLVFCLRLWGANGPDRIGALLVGSAVVGAVVGFFAWDGVRNGVDWVASNTPNHWRRLL